ncbi:MAG: hypothetical protein ABF893_04750, partial [Gluconacetobacter liquefaciens]
MSCDAWLRSFAVVAEAGSADCPAGEVVAARICGLSGVGVAVVLFWLAAASVIVADWGAALARVCGLSGVGVAVVLFWVAVASVIVADWGAVLARVCGLSGCVAVVLFWV